ncbi:hypothetical protein B0T14DRAFT_281602 [Immersiella caudata]|uniref:Uncharacterized protein n=1 Tax=Immersiella caudata TaxID=314043 RepID=A0AA40BTY4_9PEZI|nr:hypothetical protein B0T14DRAFT_281602 [Immersiella caudata]
MAPLSLRLCALALFGISWALPQDGSKSLKARDDLKVCGTNGPIVCPDIEVFDLVELESRGCCEVPGEPCHFCCFSWGEDGLECHDDPDGPPGEDLCPNPPYTGVNGTVVIHCGGHD